MNRIFGVCKFQFKKLSYWTVICFVVILANLLISVVALSAVNTADDRSGVNTSIDLIAVIMIFVMGLNCFKPSFKFLLANGVSRKSFFLGNVPFLALYSALWSALVLLITFPFRSLFHSTLYVVIYEKDSILGAFLWTFAVMFCVVSAGWLINLIYYRSGTILKTIVSISPVLLVALIVWIDRLSGYRFGKLIFKGMFFVMGFNDQMQASPVSSTLILFLFAVLFCGLCWPLLRRAQLKD